MKGLHHVGITVKDLDASIRFYHDVLGLEFSNEPSPWFEGDELGKAVGVPGAALRQVSLLAGDRQRDRGRRGIKIASVGARGKVVDRVPADARSQRRLQVALELLALAGEPPGVVVASERLRYGDRAVIAGQRPEVVPVRIGGAVRIALVADRRGHQPVECTPLRGQVLRGALFQPQAVHIGRSGGDARPHRAQPGAVARMAILLGDQMQQLAGAVVLSHRIGAAIVHAAGHLAARELVRGEPLDVCARNPGVP